MIDGRNVSLATDDNGRVTAVIIAVGNDQEAQRLIGAMIGAGIMDDVDDQ